MDVIFLDIRLSDTAEKMPVLQAIGIKRRGSNTPPLCTLVDKPSTLHTFFLKNNAAIFCGYNVTVIARAFLSLNLDPGKFKWLDLQVAHRLYSNSVASDSRHDNLWTCCFRHSIKNNIDQGISDKNILLSCQQSVEPLDDLFDHLIQAIAKKYNWTLEHTIKVLVQHSLYAAVTAIIERNGIPINIDKVNNLQKNYKGVIRHFSNPLFFSDDKFDYPKYESYIKAHGLHDIWPQTGTGRYKADEKTLAKLSLDPNLKNLHDSLKMIAKLKNFNPETSTFKAFIGQDNRQRPYYNPFGADTGRNAASARSFIFAFPTVLRALIQPVPGRAISCIDWSAQEFCIAALLSGDKDMQAAYSSGDPYLYFAKKTGAIPADGTQETHPDERQAFKSTVLGLQYGMGPPSLAIKLKVDTGYDYTADEANVLIQMHHDAFSRYWEWVAETDDRIRNREILTTPDSWAIKADERYTNQLRNWPMQAMGATLLRGAVIQGLRANLKIVAANHDSIYVEHDEGDGGVSAIALREIMDNISKHYLGYVIRTHTETHSSQDVWIDKKGLLLYPQLKTYMEEK